MSFFLLLLYLVFFYIRPFEMNPAWVQYRIMLWLTLAALLGSALTVLRKRRLPLCALQIYLMIAMFLAVVLSQVATGWFGGGLLAFIDFGTQALIFFLVILNVSSLRRLRITATTVVLLSFVLVVMGILAYHFGFMGDRLLLRQNEDTGDQGITSFQRIQALGVLNNPNDLSQAVLMVLPFLALAWRHGRWFRNFLLVILPASVFIYGIFLTHSRSGFIGLATLALLTAQRSVGIPRVLTLASILAVPLLATSFSGGRVYDAEETSAHGRVMAWSAGLEMLKSNPIWGVGYGSFAEHNEENRLAAHNSFVNCFAELGLVGYFVWLALLVVTIQELSSLKGLSDTDQLDHDLRRWSEAIKVSLYTFVVTTLVIARTYFMILYLVLGMAAALVAIARSAGKPVREISIVRPAALVIALEVVSVVFFYVIVRVAA